MLQHQSEVVLPKECDVFCICMLTNKYQKYKSVELGDQLDWRPGIIGGGWSHSDLRLFLNPAKKSRNMCHSKGDHNAFGKYSETKSFVPLHNICRSTINYL